MKFKKGDKVKLVIVSSPKSQWHEDFVDDWGKIGIIRKIMSAKFCLKVFDIKEAHYVVDFKDSKKQPTGGWAVKECDLQLVNNQLFLWDDI